MPATTTTRRRRRCLLPARLTYSLVPLNRPPSLCIAVDPTTASALSPRLWFTRAPSSMLPDCTLSSMLRQRRVLVTDERLWRSSQYLGNSSVFASRFALRTLLQPFASRYLLLPIVRCALLSCPSPHYIVLVPRTSGSPAVCNAYIQRLRQPCLAI
ncbi:hypothetical protein C8R45DRAFT_1216327 [Mycena sanguinolenta]|nr:hypothetical protein C8R45DRAFT_1216327 [Mycena sanguinolenta]